ncbi:MAG: acyl-CoA dehydrogenase family protein [Deltaproteobacteria bacterium]|nr:acyl-CoA dehydrogenase family protein [Deltaproteobacteria bacterium]MBW1921888.1 acyl-CoA dehydrogenase family protein [Deltaproteobacteria bacterium]MBW1948051.1 acyl-CoA dehydrogenase family protein [Deltaproteobacteria bacterium]MBW2006914.1 acyl-CoA dehydrogenase family protein [Deltaproteobacteria bacterium]MBW2348630.1 acyl-CoA dehydrogenase family protein [Deltaproteobacteria bacterium]
MIELPEEIEILKQTVRRFVEDEVEPLAYLIDEQERVPDQLVKKARDLGLFGLTIPEQYGGSGMGPLGLAVLREELGRTNMGFGSFFLLNNGIGSKGILYQGSDEQKEKYLPKLASGEMIACFALTEPDAGSDAGAIKTTAERRGDYYVINGTKQFITNGPVADVATVIVVTDKKLGAHGGISAVLVEKGARGFIQGKEEKKMGWHGSATGSLIFEDCTVPVGNLLGKPGQGFAVAMKTLAFGRLGVAATALGAAQRAFEMACDYASQRVAFGKPIAKQQFIQGMIADMATEIWAARLMVYTLAKDMEADLERNTEASMAKVFATEVAWRAADANVQIHGGMGYIREHPAERLYRDVRLLRIVEGTSEIQRIVISRKYLSNPL